MESPIMKLHKLGCDIILGVATPNYLQLWSPLTYRPYINSMESSKPIWKIYQQFNSPAAFLGSIMLVQSDLIFIGPI